MVIGMLRVFYMSVYALLDPQATLFLTLYNSIDFGVTPKFLLESFSMYVPVGNSVIAK